MSRRIRPFHLLALLLVAPRAVAGQPPSIVLVSPDPCAVRPSGRVTLSAPAPGGGLTLQMSSSAPTVVAVPAQVIVPAGANAAGFDLTCSPTTQAVTATITATAASGVSTNTTLTVLAPVLSTIVAQPHTGGPTVDVRVTLAGVAGAGGVIVTLSSTSNRVVLPAFVTVLANTSSLGFTIGARAAPQSTVATILATGLGVAKSVDVTIVPPVPTAVGFGDKNPGAQFTTPRTSQSGSGMRGQVTISNDAPGPFAVQLSTNQPGLITLPPDVQVTGNGRVGQFDVTVGSVGTSTNVTITAKAGGVSQSGVLTILPPPITAFVVTPSAAIGGQVATGNVTIRSDAPAGGITVNLTSSDPSRAIVQPTVLVKAGARSASFPIETTRGETLASVNITASRDTATLSDRLDIRPEGPTALSVSPNAILGSLATTGRVDALLSADAFTVELTSDNPAVAAVQGPLSFLPGHTSPTSSVVAFGSTATCCGDRFVESRESES